MKILRYITCSNYSFTLRTRSALTIRLPAKISPNKLAAKIPNNALRNPPFCSFATFLIVLLTPNNNQESSRDLTIFKTSSISSFDIINVVVPDPKIFLCILASAADAPVVNPNESETFLIISLAKIFKNGKPILVNGLRKLDN